MYFFENFEIVAISTDKNTFLMNICTYKVDIRNNFYKSEKKSARAAATSQKNQKKS